MVIAPLCLKIAISSVTTVRQVTFWLRMKVHRDDTWNPNPSKSYVEEFTCSCTLTGVVLTYARELSDFIYTDLIWSYWSNRLLSNGTFYQCWASTGIELSYYIWRPCLIVAYSTRFRSTSILDNQTCLTSSVMQAIFNALKLSFKTSLKSFRCSHGGFSLLVSSQ